MQKSLKQGVNFAFEHLFGGWTHIAVNQLSIFEEQDSGNATNAIVNGHVITLIYIVFANQNSTVIFFGPPPWRLFHGA